MEVGNLLKQKESNKFPSNSPLESKYWHERKSKRDRIEANPNHRIWEVDSDNKSMYMDLDILLNTEKEKKKQLRKEIKAKKKQKKAEKNLQKRLYENDEEEIEFIENMKKRKEEMEAADDADFIGPQIPDGLIPKLPSHLDFGKALLPGEGAAMAAYIAENKRIPRRGEIGLDCEGIEAYEHLGYVMSGSRHTRMEAVRLRKENQIYSADEKRALAEMSHTERVKKEAEQLEGFRNLLKSQLKG